MPLTTRTPHYLLAGILSSALTASGALYAQSRGDAPGYVTDSYGNIVRSGTGECVRSSDWTPEKATIVGCDGVTVDAQVEVFEGAPSGLVSAFVIPAAALFAFDSAELSEEGKTAIEDYRREVRPELSAAFAGIIIGHTDSTGSADYNLDLSLRRAEAVRNYLVETGAPADKLRVVGRGVNDPIASNDTKEGQAQNRRVEIIVVGEARALDAMIFPSVALFPRKSGELTAEGVKLVDSNLETGREKLASAVYIEVIGHTDDVGDDAYNLELSEQRARAVRDRLVEAGVDASKIGTVGAGESMPLASNQTEEGRAENRRVEILVLGRLK
ncbi:MAG: OmpA family protein [Pseudomonadota bacterium]|nr:OmpA family protein [Pseudomonadota bacterium]